MSEIAFVQSSVSARRNASASLTGERLTTALSLAVALFAVAFLFPIMLAVAAAVFVLDGGPPVFAHRRIGRNGRHFYCLKFRTMALDAEQRLAELLAADPAARAEWDQDHKLRDDPRVTRLGAFLRKTSLDELPQLFNVLRGEMNLVGPRPIVDSEAAKYGRRFQQYCAVKPGITGLWQISGRNDVSYRTRVALDCLYAKRRNLGLDAYIIVATVPAVLTRRGCY